MRRTILLAALMLAACNVPAPAPDEKADAPGAMERRLLCLPVESEAEIFRDARERGEPEWMWRGSIANACVAAQARILARGTDAAPVIADAALEHCEPHANLDVVAGIRFARRPRDYTLEEAYADQEFPEWKASTLASLRNRAIREVLQARAGGCYEELVRDSRYSHSVDTTP